MFRKILLAQPRHATRRLGHELHSSNVPSASFLPARHFSRQSILRAPAETHQQDPSHAHKAKHHPPDSGSTLIATIKAAPRPVKVVIIIAFCILSTAETIFWVQVGWRKFFGGNAKDQQEVKVVKDGQ